MTHLYIRKINIKNFRPFGQDFTLSLPGPGVTILVGPNGLGKSSLFDAIEWGLTGQVERLDRISTDEIRNQDVRRYYSRRMNNNSLAKEFAVELLFDDGQSLLRSCQLKNAAKETFEDVPSDPEGAVNILRAPEWSLPLKAHQLTTYLHQTHWLSQASSNRFLARGSQERWAAIRGPAGVERLNLVQGRLGLKTKRSLTERRKGYESAVTDSTNRLERWKSILQRREFLQQRAAGGGALSPNDASVRLRSLEAQIAQLLNFKQNGNTILAEATNTRLRQIFEQIQEAEKHLAVMVQLLAIIRPIPSAWLKYQAEQRILRVSQGTAQEDTRLAIAAAEEKLARNQALAVRLAKAAEQQQQEEESRNIIFHIASKIEEENILSLELKAAEEEWERSEDETKAAIEETQVARQKLSSLHQDEQKRREYSAKIEEINTLKILFEEWKNKSLNSIFNKLQLEKLTNKLVELNNSSNHLESKRKEQEEKLRHAELQFSELQKQSSALQGAVSAVASLLEDTDSECPVCLAYYEHGELRRRVSRALATEDVKLAKAEERVTAESKAAKEIDNEQRVLIIQTTAIQQELTSINAERSLAELLWEKLITSPGLAGVPSEAEAVETYLSVNTVRLEQAMASITSRLSEVGQDAARLELEVEEKLSVEKTKTITSSTLRERAQGLRLRLHELASILVNHSELAIAMANDEERKNYQNFATEKLEKARFSYMNLASELQRSKEECYLASETCREAERRYALITQEVQQIDATLLSLQREWERADQHGAPNDESVQLWNEKIQIQTRLLEQVRLEHQQINEGLSRWDAVEQLRESSTEVASSINELGLNSEQSCTEYHEAQVIQAEERLRWVESAQNAAKWLDEALREQASSYIPNVLGPVNVLASKFLQALSVFPRQSVGIALSTWNSKDHLVLRLRKEHADMPDDLSPTHLLSEGQLSAVSLSLLFGMSINYRWSKWRALLLDDPLQYNDIIHTAAFADVIRNLVLRQQYQIIISTHDSETANFLYRKLSSGNVTCAVCQFLSPGNDGVVTESY